MVVVVFLFFFCFFFLGGGGGERKNAKMMMDLGAAVWSVETGGFKSVGNTYGLFDFFRREY